MLKKLVDLPVQKSSQLDEFRITLRSDVDGLADSGPPLKARGRDVATFVKRLLSIHTKGIVVDGQRVLMVSQNWSSWGASLKLDASLIFDDDEIAQYSLRAIDLDWDRASNVPILEAVLEATPRLATGDEPPPGSATCGSRT